MTRAWYLPNSERILWRILSTTGALLTPDGSSRSADSSRQGRDRSRRGGKARQTGGRGVTFQVGNEQVDPFSDDLLVTE